MGVPLSCQISLVLEKSILGILIWKCFPLCSYKPRAKEKDERLLVSGHMPALYSACAHSMSALPWRSCLMGRASITL